MRAFRKFAEEIRKSIGSCRVCGRSFLCKLTEKQSLYQRREYEIITLIAN